MNGKEEKVEIEQMFELYENVRESIEGLKEILKINFLEKNFYYQAGMDNLEALNENVVEILLVRVRYPPVEIPVVALDEIADHTVWQDPGEGRILPVP